MLWKEDNEFKQILKKLDKELLGNREGTIDSHDSQRDLFEARQTLKALKIERPTQTPFLLSAALGNMPSTYWMMPQADRLRYKASYESFKVFATISHLLLSLILLFIKSKIWLDGFGNFILLYSYSTVALREHILRLNGSAMHSWWLMHHYLCAILAAVLLVWPACEEYYMIRRELLLFMVYIAAVQILQYRYQMNRLYTLRALSKVGPMQVTTESGSAHVYNSLGFLLPFIVLGHFSQLGIGWKFLKMFFNGKIFSSDWQIFVMGILFITIACGNIGTTLLTLWKKWKNRKSVGEFGQDTDHHSDDGNHGGLLSPRQHSNGSVSSLISSGPASTSIDKLSRQSSLTELTQRNK